MIQLDIQMPELDGYSVARKISETYYRKNRPIRIALIANALQGNRERSLESGMDDYRAKLVRRMELRVSPKRSYEVIRERK